MINENFKVGVLISAGFALIFLGLWEFLAFFGSAGMEGDFYLVLVYLVAAVILLIFGFKLKKKIASQTSNGIYILIAIGLMVAYYFLASLYYHYMYYMYV